MSEPISLEEYALQCLIEVGRSVSLSRDGIAGIVTKVTFHSERDCRVVVRWPDDETSEHDLVDLRLR